MSHPTWRRRHMVISFSFFSFLFSKTARGGRENLFHRRWVPSLRDLIKTQRPAKFTAFVSALLHGFYTSKYALNKKIFPLLVCGVNSEESSHTNKTFERGIKDGYLFFEGVSKGTSPDHLAAVTPSLSGWTGQPARPAGMATVNPWDRSCKGPWVINKIPITCLVPVVCYFNTPFVPRLQSLSVTAINSPPDARTAY